MIASVSHEATNQKAADPRDTQNEGHTKGTRLDRDVNRNVDEREAENDRGSETARRYLCVHVRRKGETQWVSVYLREGETRRETEGEQVRKLAVESSQTLRALYYENLDKKSK